MSKTIIFVHGAWMTPLCWESFISFFEPKGYKYLAPAWPYKDKPVAELKKNPDPNLAKLGITQIVDHYAKIINEQSEPPILIGHSFGGLFVQMLLDRGLGAAGVAIDSAAPKGVLPLYWSALKSNFGVFTTIGGWNKVVHMSFKGFQYAWVHLLPENEQKAAYDRYVVPETGRIFFQAAAAPLNNLSKVNFQNAKRAPLLLIAGAADRICPAAQNKINFDKYKNSSAVTDYKVFDNRTHWIVAQPGWQEVASYIADWLDRLPNAAK